MKPLPAFACDIDMTVRSEVTGDADRVLVNPRQLSLPFDETAEFKGIGRHWSADELFLGSLLVSLSNTFLYFVRKRKDRFAFSRLALEGSISICYDEITRIYHVKSMHVTGYLDVLGKFTAEAKKLWDLTMKACHVLHSIDKQIAIHINVEVQEVDGTIGGKL